MTIAWIMERAKDENVKRFLRWGGLLLLVLLAFGVRAGSLTTQSFWRDEVDALCYAYELPYLAARALAPARAEPAQPPCACPSLWPGSWGEPPREVSWTTVERTLRVMIRNNGPFYYFSLRAWIALAGYSEYALRFLSLWFGVLVVPLGYGLGRRLLDRAVGALTAVFLAISPYFVWYSQEVKMYTLVPLLVLLSLYALRRAVAGGGHRWWVVQVVATSLALYTHIWSVWLIPVQMVFLLTWWPRWRKHWLGALISMALLTLPYLPLALWQVPQAFVVRETGFPRRDLDEMALVLLNGWSRGVVAWPWEGLLGSSLTALLDRWGNAGQSLTFLVNVVEQYPWGLVSAGVLVVLGGIVHVLDLNSKGKGRGGIIGWLVIPVVGIWFISQWQPLFTDRYLIWTAPAFYLLLSVGLVFIWRRIRWLALCAGIGLLMILGGNLRTQAIYSLKSDVRGAAAFVQSAHEPGDLVIFQIPHLRYTFDYYADLTDYVWAEGLFTNHRNADGTYLVSDEVIDQQMAQVTWGYPTVWLVASEVSMWDERNLVYGWLEAQGERVAETHLTLVDAYRYRLSPP